MGFTRVLTGKHPCTRRKVIQPKVVDQLVNQLIQDTRRDFPPLWKTNPTPIVGLLLLSRQPTLLFPGSILSLRLIKRLLLKTALCLLIVFFPSGGQGLRNCYFAGNTCTKNFFLWQWQYNFQKWFRSHLPSKYQIGYRNDTTEQFTWVRQDAEGVGQGMARCWGSWPGYGKMLRELARVWQDAEGGGQATF